MEEVDAATEGAAGPEEWQTKKRRRRRRNKGTGGTVDPGAAAEVSTTDSCEANSSEPVDADAIRAATSDLPAEQVVADATDISSPTAELPGEQKSSASKRRSRRHKVQETRAADEADSTSPASGSPVVDGCADGGGSDHSVVDGIADAGCSNPPMVDGRGARRGSYPMASVGSDGAVTLTIMPQDPDLAPEYRDLLHWLEEARAAANAPAMTDDMYITFTIKISPLGQSGAPSTEVAAEDMVAAGDTAGDVTATSGDVTAASGNVTADAEKSRKTSSTIKRRERRRRRRNAKLAGGGSVPAAGSLAAAPQNGAVATATESQPLLSAAGESPSCCGCFRWLLCCSRDRLT